MPTCVECGAEAPREEMYGAGTDLRCQRCAARRRQAYVQPASRPLRVDGVLTKAIIVFSVVAFLWDGISARARITPARNYLAAAPAAVWEGEVWRLATSVLIHGGILHLVFNGYWLWRFGASIEAWMGRWRYLGFCVLLATTTVSSEILVSLGMPVGLSGVVYGMFGLLFAMRRQKDFAAALMDPSTVQLLIGWFFLCIVLTYAKIMPIANVAHGAGAVLGYGIGWAALRKDRMAALVAMVLTAVIVSASSVYMPWDYRYCLYRADRSLAKNEGQQALEWFRRSQQAWNAPRIGPPNELP